jgi:IS30 family transposase
MRTYHRLTFDEREEISRLLSQNCSFNTIASQLSRNVSTISREINGDGTNRYLNKYFYRAVKGQNRARRKAAKRRKNKRKLDEIKKLKRIVLEKLKLKWSPEQIVNFLKTEYPQDKDMRISHEAIYTYLYVLPKGQLRKKLLSCLRQGRKRRYKRNRKNKSGIERKLEDMISIEERPREVADRTIPGHWEGDLIIGKNRRSSLGTLVERTTRTTILVPLKNREAETVRKSFAKEARRLPKQMFLSLTYDQGREMAEHRLFTKQTEVKVYFAHPASPWERGTNENTNGLVRQFFPKGTDFNQVSRKEIKKTQHLLNGRPRKTLNWQTPYEVFNKLLR